jgi:hypothetical protein
MPHSLRGVLSHGFQAAALGLGAILATAQLAAADVIPGGMAGVEGSSDNAFPFSTDYSGFSAMRYQQVYGADAFGASPLTIYGLAFRPDGTFGGAFSTTLGNVSISLSTTTATPTTLSTNFAANEGADLTLLHSGALDLSSAFTGPDGGPKDFDVIIMFDTPFTYDPTAGDLLLEVQNFWGGFTTQLDATMSDDMARLFSLDNSATGSTGITDGRGLVTDFITTPPIGEALRLNSLDDSDPDPIPEPGSLLLFGTALAALARRRRTR